MPGYLWCWSMDVAHASPCMRVMQEKSVAASTGPSGLPDPLTHFFPCFIVSIAGRGPLLVRVTFGVLSIVLGHICRYEPDRLHLAFRASPRQEQSFLHPSNAPRCEYPVASGSGPGLRWQRALLHCLLAAMAACLSRWQHCCACRLNCWAMRHAW